MNAFVSGQQNELASPFSTKIDLQVSTIERSRESFADEVLRPALEVEPGIDRLSAMLQAGFSYAERNSFLKDFFFATTPAVLDDYPEPVRDHIRQLTFSWQKALAAEIHKAWEMGQLDTVKHPAQLTADFQACVQAWRMGH